MIGGMIGETPYDLRWRMFGIPVRVHPFFWVMAAYLSWFLLTGVGIAAFLVGVACIFVSILLHELGHAVTGNCFESRGHIVLWAFGGLAIGSTHLHSRWKRIAVTAAGPGVQLVLWALLKWVVAPNLPGAFFQRDEAGKPSLGMIALDELLWINLYWAVLNLLPIWPLDGGQISRDLFTWFAPRGGVRYSLQLSVGVCALLALHAFLTENRPPLHPYLPSGTWAGIFFAMFALFGVQALQEEYARARWVDEHTYWDDEFR